MVRKSVSLEKVQSTQHKVFRLTREAKQARSDCAKATVSLNKAVAALSRIEGRLEEAEGLLRLWSVSPTQKGFSLDRLDGDGNLLYSDEAPQIG